MGQMVVTQSIAIHLGDPPWQLARTVSGRWTVFVFAPVASSISVIAQPDQRTRFRMASHHTTPHLAITMIAR